MVLGDSLSAAYGIEISKGWVRLLQSQLEKLGFAHRVVNSSISGDTTRGGLARLAQALAETRSNLVAIIKTIIRYEARVLLVGIRLPPNYGPAYTQQFEAIFVELSEQFSSPLVPFLLEGVAEDPSLMQLDGLHPRAEAQPALLDNVWPYLEFLIP